MSIPIIEACKKRKRKPKLFGFHAFGDPNSPMILPKCPFRDKVRLFLQECAEIEDYDVHGMPIWCTLMVHESRSLVVPLYTIEEDVKSSPRPYCDQCRCTGWSNHYVSKRKYHFLIPEDYHWNKPLNENVFDVQSHLLHGLIHCNGFGHLLSINGVEGGSKYLFGREIMDLWDRICTTLQARKITASDSSKKRNMELRLLHGVAYRHPWFGRWGYGFCHGSFGVKEHNYRSALDILCSLELDKIVEDFSETDQGQGIKQIVRIYRDLSETRLITLNDLIKFMLTVKSRTPLMQQTKIPATTILGKPPASYHSFSCSKPSTRTISQSNAATGKDNKAAKYKRFSTIVANMDSRWPQRRLEFAADVIVRALKEKKANTHFGNAGMTRQDVRDAARLHIGDTGLLDYVLKSLNSVLVGNQIVRRAVNPATRILEYTIADVGNAAIKASELSSDQEVAATPPAIIPGNDVYGDVIFLYKHVLMQYPESEVVELAVQTVLDTKHFVKEWPFDDEEDQLLAFVARLASTSLADEIGEVVYLPLHSTVGDLKEAVESALRDTYCVTERVTVTEIDGLEEADDGEVLFGNVESGAEIRVRGFGEGSSSPRHQGGCDTWKVVCGCGARDDDGERMVACDVCEVWQHTRCCGIDDAEAVPPLFVCSSCCASLMPLRADREIPESVCADDLLMFESSIDYELSLGF